MSPHRFHEVIATHGFSRAFLQVLHDAKFERRQPDAARAQYELMGLDIEHFRRLDFLRRDFGSNHFRQPGIDRSGAHVEHDRIQRLSADIDRRLGSGRNPNLAGTSPNGSGLAITV